MPVSSSNRRWFTIERGEGGQAKDLLICYYKKSSAEKEDRCGWLFLNDIVALSQDIPDRWITIEHPTRIMRIQSPTPAQHRVWFHILSKYCKCVRNDGRSPSLSQPSEGGLPYFSEDSARKARRNSTKEGEGPIVSTPKDELRFLTEITGQTAVAVESVFPNASSSTNVEGSKSVYDDDECGRSSGESSSPATNLGERLSSALVQNDFPSESEGKIGRDNHNSAAISLCDGPAESRPGKNELDMNDLRTAWSESDKLLLREEKSAIIASGFSHAANAPSSSNFTLRSSTYRLLFGNDDQEDIVPDKNFLDDWDS